MSESKARERAGDTEVRGRFREGPDGNDYALPLYRHQWHPHAGYLTENQLNPRNGKPLPRVNEAKRVIRAARQQGVAL